MRQLPCPICRAVVPPGATHCPQCGIRIAPLDQRPRHDAIDESELEHAASMAPLGVVRDGVLVGVGVVALCAVVAAALAHAGREFLRTLDNASFIGGGIVLTLCLLLSRVPAPSMRTLDRMASLGLPRLADPSRLRRDHGPRRAGASTATRVSVAVAGLVPLAVAIGLAAAGH